jgi:cysteine desulfurase family protein (TIGR01976 family)
MSIDVDRIRSLFPALALEDDGQPRVYLDNPAGTQVPRQVLDRTQEYLVHMNANGGGAFRTSVASDALLDEAHRAMADLLNAPAWEEIIFGQNMTTLTFAVSRALGRGFEPGDEIIVTRMDHDANVAPWLHLADDLGLVVRWLPFDPATYRYDLDVLDGLLTDRTRLAAVNYASNALGTVNDVREIGRRVHEAGGLIYVDAVQYVPHRTTDVQALDCDFLVCSAYKFFGPHQGILWGRRALLEEMRAYKVRPASDELPVKFETGTLSHEGMAGTLGAVEYLAWVGETMGQDFHGQYAHFGPRRRHVHAAFEAIAAYERTLCRHLIDGLQDLPGVHIHGLTDPGDLEDRVPTVSITLDGEHPRAAAERLAAENIFVWDGDYYAWEVVRHLGLHERGGMVRIGLAHYNTTEEIDRLLEVLSAVALSRPG